ncbi:uncharacterized protein K460DRAFT_410992 [Cucurbitaria berberidis CBS 394.84]|uniref:DUF7730 domain-containing protein n=1 Tax=Cucurbitaria berberidis CBS 394.84 TaxID=1168544 RepID=A0A9P4G7L0_9PLEO|nr:uncharacterized protein K460DRAFT_410992 [Cucurbitaria berberidis CBS 394.84]KAF1840402.1 hypothetical protein K460DRAFT_410992 [Cucurbitaria berberidis CBS 394.84]
MAPTLRKKTQEKTEASAKAAQDAGFVPRPRKTLTRKQRYTRNKGLVSMKTPMALQSITVDNATNSPLLRLPPEIRAMIWKFALRSTYGWIDLYYNSIKQISRSGTSTRACETELQDLSISLPRVCRSIYSETATMIYSENTFAFQAEHSMKKWLSKRLLAQREAIRYMMLPCMVYDGEDLAFLDSKAEIQERVALMCPNFVEMKEDDCLDECLCYTPAMYIMDRRSREMHPSSGDEEPYDHSDLDESDSW